MSPPPVPRYNVLGVGISTLTFAAARDLILAVRQDGPADYVCLGTVHGIGEAHRDPAYRAILNNS